ncbi:AAA ATPase and NACHT domain protein [Pleurostoma richardsiae]|uniref:AAA ATPase and NACHT domain protein n=1 Tax=Pleurostoma richardsiae TaxID=41990 RepID=A0AA38R6L3_9PEZI|nr:AAA ATPase and NACHT domain protein [Pleurostoma richardsiae]
MLDRTEPAAQIREFLQVASRLYDSLFAIHDGADGRPRGIDAGALSDISTSLSTFVEGVDADTRAEADYPLNTRTPSLAVACRKVGQDLLIHIERVVAIEASHSPLVDTDGSLLRTSWPLADVEALGQRLQELTRRWTVTLGDSSSTNRLHEEFSSLSIAMPKSKANGNQPPAKNESQTPSASVEGSHATTSQSRRVEAAPNDILVDFVLDGLAYGSMRDREEEVSTAHEKTFRWIFGHKADDLAQNQFSNSFSQWLLTAELGPIYWITGKPGSGKSTLVRYLFENPSTLDHLQGWAGGCPVSMAGFFFWTSGSHEQRSQSGLLRYLLHQLLSAHRYLVPETFPTLWQKLLRMTTKERIKLSLEWEAAELACAFQRFMQAALTDTNICLFIDGLDEFEGDHAMIVNFFKDLVTSEHGHRVKLCLSSRPWPVFETALGHGVPHLRLQDLTYGDMYQYTMDRFSQDLRTQRQFQRHPEKAETIIKETIEKADGVFLWVRLAVDTMLGEFHPRAELLDARASLRELPAELDDLFHELIFKRKNPSELSETGCIFQLVRAREAVSDFIRDESAHSLTIWEVAFTLDTADDGPVLDYEVEEISDEEAEQREAVARQRLHKGFSGLLHVHAKPSRVNMPVRPNESKHDWRRHTEDRVTYIHRTVRDWFVGASNVEKRLIESSPKDFDPHLRLLRSYILRLKRPLEEPERHRRLDEWWPDIALAMTHARYVAKDPSLLLRRLVNELDAVLSWYWIPRPRNSEDHWARHAFGSYEVRMKAPPIEEPFMCLATKFGITAYVCQELESRAFADEGFTRDEFARSAQAEMDEVSQRSTPLLSYAVEFLCSRNKTIYPLSDPSLIQYLLTASFSLGCGPNHRYTDFNTRRPTTPWLTLLRHLRDARRRGWIEYYDIDSTGTKRWSEIVRLFLVHGADANAVIRADQWDPEVSAIGVLEMLEETYGAVEVKSLLKMMQKTVFKA